MPMILVGGWRTWAFALDYLLVHTWIQFAETHLRFTGQLPELPAGPVDRVIDYNMQWAIGVLLPEDLVGVNLVTTVRLSGEGEGVWTFYLRDG